jgi:hypothetical protein
MKIDEMKIKQKIFFLFKYSTLNATLKNTDIKAYKILPQLYEKDN